MTEDNKINKDEEVKTEKKEFTISESVRKAGVFIKKHEPEFMDVEAIEGVVLKLVSMFVDESTDSEDSGLVITM